MLSEEGAHLEWEQRSAWEKYWLVDPLDGTREFIKRNGEFTVNIALIDNHKPVLGVVHAPVLDTTYSGAYGIGAYKISADDNGEYIRTEIRCRTALDTPQFVLSRSHQNEALKSLLAPLPEYESVSRGSSLKFCLIAEGVADLYPRPGPTSEWDTAAGQAVVEAAGGAVWRLPDCAVLRYNEKANLLNPGFLVIGDENAPWVAALRESSSHIQNSHLDDQSA